jgi:hypothetical protein
MRNNKLIKTEKKDIFLKFDIDGMREITETEYKDFLKNQDFVVIDNVKVSLVKEHRITKFEPDNFKLETTTVWSFPERGDCGQHIKETIEQI